MHCKAGLGLGCRVRAGVRIRVRVGIRVRASYRLATGLDSGLDLGVGVGVGLHVLGINAAPPHAAILRIESSVPFQYSTIALGVTIQL